MTTRVSAHLLLLPQKTPESNAVSTDEALGTPKPSLKHVQFLMPPVDQRDSAFHDKRCSLVMPPLLEQPVDRSSSPVSLHRELPSHHHFHDANPTPNLSPVECDSLALPGMTGLPDLDIAPSCPTPDTQSLGVPPSLLTYLPTFPISLPVRPLPPLPFQVHLTTLLSILAGVLLCLFLASTSFTFILSAIETFLFTIGLLCVLAYPLQLSWRLFLVLLRVIYQVLVELAMLIVALSITLCQFLERAVTYLEVCVREESFWTRRRDALDPPVTPLSGYDPKHLEKLKSSSQSDYGWDRLQFLIHLEYMKLRNRWSSRYHQLLSTFISHHIQREVQRQTTRETDLWIHELLVESRSPDLPPLEHLASPAPILDLPTPRCFRTLQIHLESPSSNTPIARQWKSYVHKERKEFSKRHAPHADLSLPDPTIDSQLSPSWINLATLEIALEADTVEMKPFEFDCRLSAQSAAREDLSLGVPALTSRLLSDSGSQLNILRLKECEQLGIAFESIQSLGFVCKDASGRELPFLGRLTAPLHFQLKDASGLYKEFAFSGQDLVTSVFVVKDLPCPCIVGKPYLTRMKIDSLHSIDSLKFDDRVFPSSPQPGPTRMVSVIQPSSFSASLSSDDDVEKLPPSAWTKQVFPLADTVIRPFEAVQVPLWLGSDKRASTPRYFKLDEELANTEGYASSDAFLTSGSFPTILVTNESLIPITLPSSRALGTFTQINPTRAFVLATSPEPDSDLADPPIPPVPDTLPYVSTSVPTPSNSSSSLPVSPFDTTLPTPSPSVPTVPNLPSSIPVSPSDAMPLTLSPVHLLVPVTIPPRESKKVLVWAPTPKNISERPWQPDPKLFGDVLTCAAGVLPAASLPVLTIYNASEEPVFLPARTFLGLVEDSPIHDSKPPPQQPQVSELLQEDPSIDVSDEERPSYDSFNRGFVEVDPADIDNAASDEELEAKISSNVPDEYRPAFLQVLKYYRDVFTRSFRGEPWNIDKFHIDLVPGAAPYKARCFRFCHAHMEALKVLISKWLDEKVCTRANSAWASPAFFVPKPGGGLRLVVDYRELNKVTVKDRYPLPVIEDLFAQFEGDSIFSSWDALSGFNQQAIDEESKHLTSFICPLGLFQMEKLSMGLANGPSSFQRAMYTMTHDLPGSKAYIDDVSVSNGKKAASPTEEGLGVWDIHLFRVANFLHRCAFHRLRLNLKKCFIGEASIKYLGFIISEQGLKPDPEKVQALQTIAPPTSAHDIRVFLGLINYYRSFIPDCAALSAPLTRLLTKGADFVWTPLLQECFDLLKQRLADDCLRNHYDSSLECELYTDCSDYASGAVLSQKVLVENGEYEDRVLAYFSRTLTEAERNYSTYQKECLAIVCAIKYFHQFLAGRHFTLFTDHYSLASVLRWKDPPMRIARWLQYLSTYHFTAKYKAGSTLLNADAMSRLPSHYVRKKLSPSDLPGQLEFGGSELGSLSANPRLKDMIEDNIPNILEVQARTPIGPISVSYLGVFPNRVVPRRSTRLAQSSSSSLPPDTSSLSPNPEPVISPNPPDALPENDASTLSPPEFTSTLPDPFDSSQYDLFDLQSYIGRIFVDSEENVRYVITDIWFDDYSQEFVGTRAPADGSFSSPESLQEAFLMDYFLSELSRTPVESMSTSSQLDDIFRESVRQSLTEWYSKGVLKPHEVFLIPDENETFHFYRRVYDDETSVDNYQLLIPNGPSGTVIKQQLLFSCHDGCGHLRFNKMYHELIRRCWWPGMYSEAKAYCRSCNSCQIAGTRVDRQERQVKIFPLPSVYRPFQRVSVDILSLDTVNKKKRYLLVAVDHFSKWVEAEAYDRDITAEDVNDFMMSHFFLRHGVPEVILADNGSNITANQLNALLFQELGAQCKNTTTYHPQANGQVERFNDSICSLLKHYLSDNDHTHWPKYVDATVFALNTSVSVTTGFTPFFLVHGREARRLIDRQLPDWAGTKWRQAKWRDFADSVVETLRRCHEVAASRIHRAHSMYNQPRAIHRLQSSLLPLYRPTFSRPDDLFETLPSPYSRRITRSFLPGDLVLIYVPVTQPRKDQRHLVAKFTKFWRGPFSVIRCINDVIYLIQIQHRQQPFHINRLKPYFPRHGNAHLSFV
jgi:transposase InsO family protein